jgi:predicted lipoprotein with Yx(FWY)xxD motif
MLAAALVAGSGIGLLAAPAGAAGSPTVVTVAESPTWGKVLVLGNGRAVYRLTADGRDKSVCFGACAKVWPPVLLAAGQKKPTGHGVSGLGTIKRPGGARQVTFDGIPLYLYVGDHQAGQANGNVKDTWGQWWVVDPASPRTAPTAATSTATTAPGAGVAY